MDAASNGERSPFRFWVYSFWIVLALAFINRWTMAVAGYTSTFDTGTPGLMAVNILKGERPLFFYGQHYMGALEAYVAALFFYLFGISETVKTLSPILFSLGWIAATYALFTECLDRRAGFASALVLAYPGWQTLWYNIGTYGGYPGAFFFGTMVLWLAVRLLKRGIKGLALLFYLPGIALFAGTGIWTNYICGAYLVLAAILLIIHKYKVVGLAKENLPYILSGFVFLFAVFPVVHTLFQSGDGGQVASFSFSSDDIKRRLDLMTSNLIPELFYWPFSFSSVTKKFLAAMLIPALAGVGAAFWKPQEGLQRRWMLVPLYFLLIYLALYLPHSMASIRASRYLIPGFSIFLCLVFSYGFCARGRGWPFLAALMLILWTAYNSFSARHMMDLRSPKTLQTRAVRQEVITACERLGLQNVGMLGGYVFGHLGQTYSFLSGGKISFGSLFDERHPATSQALETPGRQAFLCEKVNAHKVLDSFRTLNVEVKETQLEQHTLFHDINVEPRSSRLLPGSQIKVHRVLDGEDVSDHLSDRHLTTYVLEEYDKYGGWVIDLQAVRPVNQLWLLSPEYSQQTLPKDLLLLGSLDGKTWTAIYDRHERVSHSYTKGNAVYFVGYRSIMEYRFQDTDVRFIKMVFRKGSHPVSPAKISELYVFEAKPSPGGTLEDDLEKMESFLDNGTLSFLVADRWVSGHLYSRPGLQNKVRPRYNPKFRATRYPAFFSPSPGTGLAVSRAVADESETFFHDRTYRDISVERIDLNYYTVFRFVPNGTKLSEQVNNFYFNGHSLLHVSNDETKELESLGSSVDN